MSKTIPLLDKERHMNSRQVRRIRIKEKQRMLLQPMLVPLSPLQKWQELWQMLKMLLKHAVEPEEVEVILHQLLI